jgi:hypothetical protein
MQGYNLKVKKRVLASALLAVFLVACAKHAPQDRDAVKQAIIEHLGKGSGLDLSLMDIEVSNVAFQGNEAKATVMFRPKSAPDQGMQMNYTLESQADKWVVSKKAGANAGHGAGAMPSAPAPDSGALPPGHPPVSPSETPAAPGSRK